MLRKLVGDQYLSKSDLIKLTSKENVELGPTELAKLIQAKYNVKVSPSMISTINSQTRKQEQQQANPQSGQNADRVSVDAIVRIKSMVDEVGGIEEAKRALDTLGKILA